MEFKTIKELYEAVKSGRIDESKLEIILDNDCTSFYIDKNYEDKIEVKDANGCRDIQALYLLLFPKAEVEWC